MTEEQSDAGEPNPDSDDRLDASSDGPNSIGPFEEIADEESGEPNPEAGLFTDETALGPDPPEPPKPPEVPDPSEAPKELRRDFWKLVLIFNVAVFGVSVGPIVGGFTGNWRAGGALFVVGLVALVRGLYRYRAVRERHG